MDLGKLGYGGANPWPKAVNEIIYRHLLDRAQAVDDLLASLGRHLTERGVDPRTSRSGNVTDKLTARSSHR